MPFEIRKSKTFKGKFEVRRLSGRLFAADLTKRQADTVKRLGTKFDRCVKKVKPNAKSPFAVCKKSILGKKLKKIRKRK